MIFDKKELAINNEIYKIDISKINYSWEGYLSQYVKVLDVLIKEGLNNGNSLKQQFMPFLFVFRHIIELTIKNHLKKQGITNDTHNIKNLTNSLLGELPKCFLDNFSDLKLDGEGDSFRYIEDKNSQKHYAGNEVIDALKILNSYEKWHHSKGMINVLPIVHADIRRRSQYNNFIFYIQDCRYLGVLRTQYDTCVSTLITAIKKNDVSVEEILMPLMLLIRHSIELGLKDNLEDIVSPEDKKKMMKKGHKLRGLYNILTNGYLQKCIHEISDCNFKNQTEIFLQTIERLSNTISLLDNNSLDFRFPIKTIQLTDNTLIETYELYKSSDTFLTIGTGVLIEYGYLIPTNNYYELDLFEM